MVGGKRNAGPQIRGVSVMQVTPHHYLGKDDRFLLERLEEAGGAISFRVYIYIHSI